MMLAKESDRIMFNVQNDAQNEKERGNVAKFIY